MTSQVPVPPGRNKARRGEDRLHIHCLSCSDLHEQMTSRRQVAG